MHLRAFLWLVFLSYGAWFPCRIHAGDADLERAVDEKALRDAGVRTDGESLLTFFKQRTLSDADHDRLRAAVRRLGDDDFRLREQATADLAAAGRAVLPFLRTAARDPDPEVVHRARRCIAALEETTELNLLSAAARLLAGSRPP